MDAQYQIQLGSQKNINSVNVDNYIKIELSQKTDLFTEYDSTNVLDVTSVYDRERQATNKYRIYGKIQYLSLLNRLRNDYKILSDIFLPKLTNCKTLINSFDFYLIKPSVSGYTQINTSSINQYIRKFDVIGIVDDIEITLAGFSNNLFFDNDYSFNINFDVDVSDYYDNFNFPITELYLFAQYKIKNNGDDIPETTYSTSFNINTGIPDIIPFTANSLNIGDIVYGDVVQYEKNIFFQNQLLPQEHYIKTPITSGNTVVNIMWKYNPFIELKLRYLSDDLNIANISGTTYEEVASIPNYATSIDNTGNYVWRNILDQGFIDPISGIGVDYPFVNKKRYLFADIVFNVEPYLEDYKTSQIFSQIKYGTPTIYNNKTNSDLNNIGKPCV
jgi:hypothetical protein